MKNLIALIIAVSLLATVSLARTPEEVADEYFQLVKRQDWEAVAELYDPAALGEFRDMMSFLFEAPDEMLSQMLVQFFGQGATMESVTNLSDKQYVATFLRNVMASAAMQGQLDFKNVDVLGSVAEGGDTRHVVARTHIVLGGMEVEAMEILTMRQTGDAWLIQMQSKMKALAQQMKVAFQQQGQQQQPPPAQP